MNKRSFRKSIAILLAFFFLLTFLPISALAQEKTNDETVVFTIDQKSYTKGDAIIKTDIAPYIKDGRTMVPVAFVAPALGTEKAKWNAKDQMVLIKKGDKQIAIFIGKKEILVNNQKIKMDVAAEIADIGDGGGRTMLPIAHIARALDLGYKWKEDSRTVHFYGKNFIYDKAGVYGPDSASEVKEGNVIVKAHGVKLQNLNIKGNLVIAEEVGKGDVYLNNVVVEGQTYVRGGGKDSIHINGGQYNNITIQNVDGQVRIVATDVTGAQVVIAEEAQGEEIILEGAFEKVTVEAEGAKITTQGKTTINQIEIKEEAKDTKIELAKDTVVKNVAVAANTDIQGQGTIEQADVNADNVNIAAPVANLNVGDNVTPPTSTPAPGTTTGGGGGGPSASDQAKTAFLAGLKTKFSELIGAEVTIDNSNRITVAFTQEVGPNLVLNIAEGLVATLKSDISSGVLDIEGQEFNLNDADVAKAIKNHLLSDVAVSTFLGSSDDPIIKTYTANITTTAAFTLNGIIEFKVQAN